MSERKTVGDRALELADSGVLETPSQLRNALVAEGYTQSDLFTLEGRATRRRLGDRFASGHVGKPT